MTNKRRLHATELARLKARIALVKGVKRCKHRYQGRKLYLYVHSNYSYTERVIWYIDKLINLEFPGAYKTSGGYGNATWRLNPNIAAIALADEILNEGR